MEINDLNFDEFHPLDHRPGSARCRSFYGGARYHVYLWWTLQCEWTPSVLRHKVLCRRGHHVIQGGQKIMWFGTETTIRRCCVWCEYEPNEGV